MTPQQKRLQPRIISRAVNSHTKGFEMSKYVVAAFYKFARLPDYKDKQPLLQSFCLELGVKGTILLAEEGVNGTIAGPRAAVDTVLAALRSDARLSALAHKESYTDTLPFYRMKVKLKKEIVTLGVAGIDPNRQVGTYVSPEKWNDLISDPEVTLVDTRNRYEVGIGTFNGAHNPNTDSFVEFPEYVEKNLDKNKHRKVAMFCTGGIRCEKASAYMLAQGFEEVYHLEGGILKYLENIPAEESEWQGECFVFDQRVAVDHDLESGSYQTCYACRHPLSATDLAALKYEEGICCPYCVDELTEEKRAPLAERQRQVELAEKRNTRHIGG